MYIWICDLKCNLLTRFVHENLIVRGQVSQAIDERGLSTTGAPCYLIIGGLDLQHSGVVGKDEVWGDVGYRNFDRLVLPGIDFSMRPSTPYFAYDNFISLSKSGSWDRVLVNTSGSPPSIIFTIANISL